MSKVPGRSNHSYRQLNRLIICKRQETFILKYRMPNQGHKKERRSGRLRVQGPAGIRGQGFGARRNKMMRKEGKSKRGETGVFIYTKTPSSNTMITNASITSHLGLMRGNSQEF